MNNGTGLSRRDFLATGAAAVAFPMVVSSSVLGRDGAAVPSERIRVGLVGCGNHGVYWNLPQIFRCPEVQVVAVCDVDSEHLADGKRVVDEHYGQILGRSYEPVATYGDFRKLILRKDVDALVNCTPDHWHVIPAIMAAKCGKDVISEKPLTLFIAEGQALCKTVKDHKRIFQTASENRSIDVHLRIAELVRGGAVGKIQHIDVGVPTGNNEVRLGPQAKATFSQRSVQPVPKGLDYEMWSGQAPLLPYIPARIHGAFRWNLAYSGGVICDWGAHMIDIAQWGHDTEHTGPVEVEGKGDFPPRDAVFNTAPTFEVNYRYADGVTMTLSSRGPMVRFTGTDGWVELPQWRAGLKASSEEILHAKVDPEKARIYHPSEIEGPRDGAKGGEHRNFYDCVKSRKPTYAPAEIGHRTISVAHIGNIAMQLGRKLKWDPDAETFPGEPAANAMLTRVQREPWTIANIDKWI